MKDPATTHIGRVVFLGELDGKNKNIKHTDRGSAPDAYPSDKQDPITITKLQALYRRAEELANEFEQESIVDKEKVNAIKAAILNGTYQVDAENIAQKLMELETELGRGPLSRG